MKICFLYIGKIYIIIKEEIFFKNFVTYILKAKYKRTVKQITPINYISCIQMYQDRKKTSYTLLANKTATLAASI